MASCSSSCSAPLKKQNCPLRMADGRFMTDYRPHCQTNAELNGLLAKNNLPMSSYDLRMYLQQNGLEFIQNQTMSMIDGLAPCVPCSNPPDPSTMLPEQYVVKCDETSCQRKLVNPNGLGDGRSY